MILIRLIASAALGALILVAESAKAQSVDPTARGLAGAAFQPCLVPSLGCGVNFASGSVTNAGLSGVVNGAIPGTSQALGTNTQALRFRFNFSGNGSNLPAAGDLIGFYTTSSLSTTGTLPYYKPMAHDFAYNGSGTISSTIFSYMGVSNNSTGTLTDVALYDGQLTANGGTISNLEHFRCTSLLSGATAPGAEWCIYSSSSMPSYLAGPLELAAGTQAHPSIAYSGNLSTGIFFDSSGSTGIEFTSGNETTFEISRAGIFAVPYSSGPEMVLGAAGATTPTLLPSQATVAGIGNCGYGSVNVSVWTGSVTQQEACWTYNTFTMNDSVVSWPSITSDATLTDSALCWTSAGNIHYGSGTLGACLGTSSRRYKHDIIPLDVGLTQIMRLRPIKYFYNEDVGDHGARLQYGMTAEDVVKVLPSLTHMDEKGQPNSIDLVGMIPVLIKAIQQQQAEINDLKSWIRNHHQLQ